MRIPISRLVKELNLEAHQLREWEKRDWLGEVIKDPRQNHQRVYTEEQIECIEMIAQTIQNQRVKGIKRTNFEEVEAKLLDRFGGEDIDFGGRSANSQSDCRIAHGPESKNQRPAATHRTATEKPIAGSDRPH
ncbi:hypothetical protein CXF77_16170 [Planococcus sp. MB-3u-09]|nr:hypothetical protein CW734_17095 [Planococcus sp. MB-3u-03]PKG46206.1 hypothetical protein CXF66_07395 [Planococcus sp. Urea-trap-24]PKG89992.1 hypothetical protein CXF91_03740 [Planococcus sp. Urea-3u-39]PKH35704.1 hypothetical protein CXF77_16170 [Planococcus sp. MB-3u-09]